MITGIGALNPLAPTGGTTEPGSPAGGATGGAGVSFAEMVADTAGKTVDRLKEAEHLSMQALQGKGDMRQVVDAVMSAEQSFQAAVAIRDKIVTAYLEVSRMAI
ncbi:flagellar hook-basal body complex protein FliE [Pseudaminobacter sp. 19-2017]|uniref:Flagellar hook-basal body complex protein FliE n=1 Tax=Pseudaminobacter soli (ex Zhang et al. 2022) TaxID=2831468 RepID=A0A942I9H8_9HYPH|nr:flagellar hook-basal body complex protein FliE [Pseudaminobacter soli]MBS3650330.1 flagellar hook-basal body complex protein FliE [Pseudaminobacter soli]